MKLSALAEAFEAQRRSAQYAELSFEERVRILIDTEWTARENRKLARRLKAAKMRHSACLENVNFKTVRGLNRQQVLNLGSCAWIAVEVARVWNWRTATGPLKDMAPAACC